jgi:glycerol-3-phosphate dehydrogenase
MWSRLDVMSVSAPGSLNAARRRRDLDELGAGAPVDLVVVGGGITGAGVALDAATRGLRTVLLERHDLAAGTSRWSSKLVHGGLRYLASGEIGLALESARERHVLMTRTAPHLVRPLPYLVPLGVGEPDAERTAARRAEAAATRAGLLFGDVLRAVARTAPDVLPRSRPRSPAWSRASRRWGRRARSWAGTGSWRTTPASSSRSPGPRRPPAPGSSPARASAGPPPATSSSWTTRRARPCTWPRAPS